jgi:DNA invertase Pin-like site-specific DNA recombinase
MRIGYARVSTAEQNLNLQLDALKKAKCKRIYEEHGSGKDSARLELLSCLKALREIRGRDGSTPRRHRPKPLCELTFVSTRPQP